MELIIFAIFAIWYLFGVFSFGYWWTTQHNIEIGTLFIAIFAGLLGPIAFVLGYAIHGEHSNSQSFFSKVLIKKRTK